MVLLIVKSRKSTNTDSIRPPAVEVGPQSKGKHPLHPPRWPGFKRWSFIKRKGGRDLVLDSQSADRDGHSEHCPAGPEGAAQAFLRAVWAEPGARTEQPFLFHMIHSPTRDIKIIHFQKKQKTLCFSSAHQSTPVKLKHTHTHLHSIFIICWQE